MAEAVGKPRIARAPRSKRAPAASEDSRCVDAPPARSEQVDAEAEALPLASGGKRKRGRPTEQYGTVVLSLRLPGELVEAVDQVVSETGEYRDRSEFIRRTLAGAISLPQNFGKVERERLRASMAANARLISQDSASIVGYVRQPDGRLVEVYSAEPEHFSGPNRLVPTGRRRR